MRSAPKAIPTFVALLLALFAFGCASGGGGAGGGVYYATGKDVVTPDGLHRVKWEPFSLSFVRPGAKLGGYDAIILDEVTVSYKRPPKRKNVMPGLDDGLNDNFALSSPATASMKRYFQTAFSRELGKNNAFKIVEKAGPNVLRVAGHIVGLVITAPPQNQQMPDETVYTSSSGSMTLVLTVEDSVTGESLVEVGQRQDIGNGFQDFYASNPVTNSGAVRQLFDGWAMSLRREIEQLKALPEIPVK